MIHSILWRRIDLPGHEFARLAPRDDGWELSGTAVFAHEGRPCKLDYAIRCAADWRTVAARVEGRVGEEKIALKITTGENRHWFLNGVECPAVEGCVDIDLGFSPSTNLLPIRRLSLPVGDEAAVRAAWLPFPALTFELLPQVYRRETETAYRYESAGGRFVRTLEVDAVGFVTDYPGLWQAEVVM